MTYQQTLQFLESCVDYEKIPFYPYKESLGLARIKEFLTLIGNPQEALRCLHIAGTKGKGSTCAFLTYILREAGYKTGLYTSPHLSDFRERIRILVPQGPRDPVTQVVDFEGMISKKELANLVERLKPVVEKYNKLSKYGPLTFFEVYTALAFMYFKEKKADFVVLETGLGGRLDATNAVEPLVCAITPISLEHTQKLGNTLSKIAAEKAGIIKVPQGPSAPGTQLVVISAPQRNEVRQVIRKRCKEKGAKLYEVGRDICVRLQSPACPERSRRVPSPQSPGCKARTAGFELEGLVRKYSNLNIKLLGGHQVVNAAVSVGVVEALKDYNINIGTNAIKNGLYHTVWPGRCEIIARNPLVVLDGAQNVASARVLKEAIKENFRHKRLILVLGISGDKDIKGICRKLVSLADKIILTQANSLRAARVEEMEKILRPPVPQCPSAPVIKTKSVRVAMELARGMANKQDLILVTGSLFVVGEARKLCGI